MTPPGELSRSLKPVTGNWRPAVPRVPYTLPNVEGVTGVVTCPHAPILPEPRAGMGSRAMTAADFRRIALSMRGVEEVAHGGLPAFRVGGTRFASLASQSAGYGNLTLTLEQQ